MSDSELVSDGININHLGIIIDVIERLVIEEKRSLERIAKELKVDVQTLQREMIIHLSKKDYDVERISRVLNIDKSIVQQEFNSESIKPKDTILLNKYSNAKKGMNLIRYNYYQRFFPLDSQFEQYRFLRVVDAHKKVAQIIQTIEEDLAKLSSDDESSKEKIVGHINRTIGTINNNRLTINDCWAIMSHIQAVRAEGFGNKELDSNEHRIIKLLLIEIVRSVNQARSIDELGTIYQKVTELDNNYKNITGKEFDSKDFRDIVNAIEKKLKDAEKDNEVRQIVHHIPPEMHNAICGLLDESLGIDKIRTIIYYKDPQNDGIEKMIRVLSERSDIYPLSSQMYSSLMMRFIELVDGDEAKVSLFRSMFIENLCQQRKFGEAQTLIEETIKPGDDKYLQEIVLYREIGDLILKQIGKNESSKEDEIFLETIRKRLNQSGDAKAAMKKIILGKDQFGIETISLDQIMELEPKKKETKKPKDVSASKKTPSKIGTTQKSNTAISVEPSTTESKTNTQAVPLESKRTLPKGELFKSEQKAISGTAKPTAPNTGSVKPKTRTHKVGLTQIGKVLSDNKRDSIQTSNIIRRSGATTKTTQKTSQPVKTIPELSTKLGEKLTPMERIRKGYYKRQQTLGLDEKKYKVIDYEEDPLKVAESLNKIKNLFTQYSTSESKLKITREINEELESILNLHMSLDECIGLLRIMSHFRVTPNTDLDTQLRNNKQAIVSHIFSEAILDMLQANSLDEIRTIIGSLGEANRLFSTKELNDFVRLLNGKNQDIVSYYVGYKITHEISPNMDQAIRGFLDGTIQTEQLKSLINSQEGGDNQLNNSINNFRKIISERGDIYPIDSSRVPELLKQFIELYNSDKSKRNTFMDAVINNLCRQGKYDKAEEAIESVKIRVKRKLDSDGNIIERTSLTEEDSQFNQKVEQMKVLIILRNRISYTLLKTIENKISDGEDARVYNELRRLVFTSEKIKGNKEAFWDSISLGKDILGKKITLGNISRDERSYV